ncbi:Glycoside hydrolase, 38 vacuolar alpha mannosidase [Linnemannia gamsii]|uniref:alpha-mannosidase n=1 Tax=Linnemannia gamsii TaxID=64522 RepID=A0ABQ7KFL6_9FUNG|nr:Glycoside hydrolase, 38 vacuolar alpha mannosidase [Linnemannia gamsii]
MTTLSAQPRFLRSITLDRANKFVSTEFYTDVNLYSKLYKKRSADAVELSVYSVPDLKRITFEKATKQSFHPTSTGTNYGPSWSTHWFKLKITVPKDWAGEHVELLWDSSSEAMIWSTDGIPRQGLTGDRGNDRRVEYTLLKKAKGGDAIDLWVEMACNGMFGAGKNGVINPPEENRTFHLSQVELAVPNHAAWQLFYDMQVITGMANELPNETARGQEALYALNQVIDIYDRDDLDASLKKCLQISHEFLSKKAAPDAHHVTAVGNCHIDTAWLWPYAETRRKTARSWSTQLRLLEDYPEYVFVCPQAQQLEWLAHDYPKLFQEIKEASKKGRFQVIGSTWVEMDCNLPSGEALCRQFLYGQRYYEKNFGARSKIFWLPDTFGYSAQVEGRRRPTNPMLRQFPNTTFTWVGLDGTKILTHMAPCETYTAQADVGDMVRRNNHDLAFSNQSLMPYGNGDGGGGPQRAMLERLRRMKDVDGLPRCDMGGADDFFESVEAKAKGLQEWKGELYFELHRGTYTSQAAIKRYNRKLEFLLRDVEITTTLCVNLGRDYAYPKAELDVLWKDLLLNQFHDVIPGSSIELANIDARAIYKDIETKGKRILKECLRHLYQSKSSGDVSSDSFVAFNSLGWDRSEIIEIPAQSGGSLQQYSVGKNTGYVRVDNGAFEYRDIADSKSETSRVQAMTCGQELILDNEFIVVKFNQQGHLVSLYDKHETRELVPKGQAGNQLKLYEDMPLYWEAWDVEIYHLNTGKSAGPGKARIGEVGPLRATIIVDYKLTDHSTASQTIVLTAASPRLEFHMEADWHESRKLLKVEFTWDIISDFATYDSQFGVIQRPTTYNTSQDFTKFEVCGHKFADLSEHGYGVALLNDCKFGYSTHGNVMRLSLLRSPKAPDLHCDMGHHEFAFAVLPHKGTFHESNVVRQSYQFNVPMVVQSIAKNSLKEHKPISYFEIKGAKNVILDTIKRAEDSDHIIIRLYEAFGGRAQFKLKSFLNVQSVVRCNILEDDGEYIEFDKSARASGWIVLHAFEILTLKLKVKTIISSPEVSSEDESTPKAKPVKKAPGPVMRTTRAEASRIATGSKPGTRTVQRTPATAAAAIVPKPSVKPSAKPTVRPAAKTVAVKPKVASTLKPTSTPKTTSAKLASTTTKAEPVSLIKGLKAPAKRGRPKKNPPNPSGKRKGDDDTPENDDAPEDDVKQDLEDEQQTLFTEMETEPDWKRTSTKRPAQDCWLFPSLLKRVKANGKQSATTIANFADEPAIKHVIRAHSRNTHEGQDEDEVDTWAVAFQPTLPVLRLTPGGGEEQDDNSGSDDEDEGDDDADVEEVRIRRRNKRLAKELSQQAPRSSSIVATCGGNTVCLIDCRLGKVMVKYSHVEEEEFMALAWTTLDHDQDMEGDDNTTKERRLEQTNILAAAGRLGSIKLINPLQNTCYKYLHGHTDSIVRLKFSLTNPRWLFSASTDGSVRLWDIGSLTGFETEARCLAEFTRQGDAASVTAIGVSEKYLIVGTEQGLMAQYNLFNLNSKLESDQVKNVCKVLPERIYPVSQEWHESSVDDIIYVPYFSEKSYAALHTESKTDPKAGKKSSKASVVGARGRSRGRGGRGGRGRGRGRGGSSANRGGGSSDSEEGDNSDDEDKDDGEFVFASRESYQGEFIVWDAAKSTATDAALKTILEWSIGESWAKFMVAENRVTNLSLRKSLSSSTSTSSKPMGNKKKAEKMEWIERRQSVLVAGMANGALAIYDLSRPPKKASDGNIIACKPDRIISNGVSSELLRDVAVSEDLSMMVGGDWSNKVLLWSRDRDSEGRSAIATSISRR